MELRATKSEATRVDTPPKGKASKRGFLVTMAVSTSIIVGSKASTSSRMVSASDSATGVGTAWTSAVAPEIVFFKVTASL